MKKLILALLLLTSGKAFATDGTWSYNATAANYWTNPACWSGSIVAGGAGSRAVFTNDLTAQRAVNIDCPITNGTIVLGDSVSTYYAFQFTNGGGYIVFDGAGSSALVDRSFGDAQADLFSVPVRLNTDLIISNNIAGSLTFSGSISNINGGVATIYNQGSGTGLVTCTGGILNGGANNIALVQNTDKNIFNLGSATSTFDGGITVKKGTLRNSTTTPFGASTLYLGDTTGTNNTTWLSILTTTLTNRIETVAGNTGKATIMSSGAVGITHAGVVWLNNHDLYFMPQNNNFIHSGAFGGTGDVVLAGYGSGVIQLTTGTKNHVGCISNISVGPITLSAVVSNNVTKIYQNSATSTMTISGNNSEFAGNVVVQRGILSPTTLSSCLGSGLVEIGDSNINADIVVYPANSVTLTNRFVVRGGNTGTASLSNNAANPVHSGPLWLDNHDVFLKSGTLSLTKSTGPISGTGSVMIASLVSGTITISAPMAHIGAITNNGPGSGAVTLSGTISNTVSEVVQNSLTSLLTISAPTNLWTGGTWIKRGVCKFGAASALSSPGYGDIILGDTTGSDNAILNNGVTFTLTNRIVVRGGNTGKSCISNSATLFHLTCPIHLDNHDLSLVSYSVMLNGATVTGTGSVLFAYNSGARVGQLAGVFDMVGAISNSTTGGGPALIAGVVSNNVTAIIQNSPSTIMSNTAYCGTYTGATLVAAGTLAISGTNNNATLTINSGGTCQWQNASNPAMSTNGNVYLTTGGKLDIISGKTQTVNQLYIDSTQQVVGTWGSTTSAAANVSTLFAGLGVLNVTNGPAPVVSSVWQVRYIVPPPSTFLTTNLLTHPGNWTNRTFAAAEQTWTDPNSALMYNWSMQTNFVRGTQLLAEITVNTNNAVKTLGSEYLLPQFTNTWRTEQACDFGGSRTYACSNMPCLNTTNYSFATWLYVTNAPGAGEPYYAYGARILEQDDAPGNKTIGFVLTSNMTFNVTTYSGGYAWADSTSKVPLSTWTHCGVVVTGTLAQIYINGRLDATGTVKTVTGTASAMFGQYPYSVGFASIPAALMGDTFVYQKGLSSQEVYNVYYNTPTITGIGNGAGNIRVRP